MGQVRERLYSDAKNEKIIETFLPADKNNDQKTPINIQVVDYPKKKQKFDDIIQAVADYFALFKNNTERLEDLFLQLIEILELEVP